MKAIIFNNNRALIVNILEHKECENSLLVELKLTVNPVVTIKVDSSKLVIVRTDKEEQQSDVAETIAEALLGPEGKISYYEPETRNNAKKLTNKMIKK